MLHSITGAVSKTGENFFILNSGAFDFKIFTNTETLRKLSQKNDIFKCLTHLYIREENIEIYGFLEEETMKLFLMLITISGVGPKTAMGILDVDRTENIMAAIIERRPELLMRTSGIGQKTAERIILELQSKIKLPKSSHIAGQMDINHETEEALVSLGYGRQDVRRALSAVDPGIKKLEERLKEGLKLLGRKHL